MPGRPPPNHSAHEKPASANTPRAAGTIPSAEQFGDHLLRIDHFLQSQEGVSKSQSAEARMVLEELVLNAFVHGAAEETGGVAFSLEAMANTLVGTVSYDGAPFDPTAPIPEELFASDQVGGRGLAIIQGLSSHLSYSRDGQRNHVTFAINSI